MHPLWDATMLDVDTAKAKVFQFMHPLWDATAKYSIHISIYTIFCICYILLHLFHNDIDVNFMFQFVIIGASLSVFLCILRIRTNFLEPHVYIIYFYTTGYTLCVNCNFIIFH